MKKQIDSREAYKVFNTITTRWSDNDAYGHVNNVTYYSYFDTAANCYLIEEGGLDIVNSPAIGYVVSSACEYHSAVAYPDKIEAGLRVDRLGNSSVQYGIAIFKEGEQLAAAQGHFVHVFVDRVTQKPVPIPESIRTALEKILC
ncbi:acyl-CoA thioesterase [Alkalimarinus sediminis]|uniref:Acyl-CoA thioesterase n=1 Tax=Alkalimarinus sediminis TaxID=1632866 RepID=A0A9E8HV21_9ALTE|nr:thioesterase family protein [Alkalimarinus sediminis]UZW76259.1 acyl-CoA thioesterase [Alkalimarinus sediminis]